MNIKNFVIGAWVVIAILFMGLALAGVIYEHNLMIKLSTVPGGFICYSLFMLVLNKDEYDDSGKAFPIIEYGEKNWDNWLLNWFFAILLLVSGHSIFGVINLLQDTAFEWKDGYYAGSGFIVNFLLDRYKAMRKK